MCVDDDDEYAISKKPPLLIAQDTQINTEHPTQIRGCVLLPRTQMCVKSAREKNHMRIEVFVSSGVSHRPGNAFYENEEKHICLTISLLE